MVRGKTGIILTLAGYDFPDPVEHEKVCVMSLYHIFYSLCARNVLTLQLFLIMIASCKDRAFVHRCGPGGSMRACHTVVLGSIPGRDKFRG